MLILYVDIIDDDFVMFQVLTVIFKS